VETVNSSVEISICIMGEIADLLEMKITFVFLAEQKNFVTVGIASQCSRPLPSKFIAEETNNPIFNSKRCWM